MKFPLSTLILAAATAGTVAVPGQAGDWPQILGPSRNGVAEHETIRRVWNGAVPETVWQHAAGQGYAGVAVVGHRAILFHRQGDREVVEALDARAGTPLWRSDWPTHYQSRIDPDSGPRSVPVVHADAVYLHGAGGRLVCLSLRNGRQRWARETRSDFGFREGYFGAASSPLVAGDKLLLNVGGHNNSGIVAFSLTTGETLWKATNASASYASPVAATVDGNQLALFVTRLQFLGIDIADGQQRFAIPFGMRGPTVNGANPLLIGDRHVFLTASYGVGARLVRLEGADAKVLYSRQDLMSSQYTTGVFHDDVVYGIDGREDIGTPDLRALDPLRGEVHWTQKEFGMATLILAGKTLLFMKTDGQLVLVDANRRRYHELARFRVFDGVTRALPALANGRLYVRDAGALKCVDLSVR